MPQLTTKQYEALHQFLADRLADLGPAKMADPLAAGLNTQLIIHGDFLLHRDHGALDARDAGLIDGYGLALRHAATRWSDHPQYDPAWTPPRVDVQELFEYGPYR
ncbi:hypothetical protein ACODT3_43180 [Streptomyces sp. 4.24]|uniref:hypothetical protein n=1 Tax=Streptomyces tritrimontium TaxID=3406573 RepID=UPI003BB7F11F